MTPLIPLIYLNEATFLSEEVDEKKYHLALKLAQLDLRDVLGGEFYEEIENQYPSSLSSDNDTLYEDYIKDYLAWRTYFHHLKFSQSDSTQTGERQFKDENSDILGDVKLYAKEREVEQTALKYKNMMVNFLRLSRSQDSTKYTKWLDNCKTTLGWAISGVTRGNTDFILSANRTQIANE